MNRKIVRLEWKRFGELSFVQVEKLIVLLNTELDKGESPWRLPTYQEITGYNRRGEGIKLDNGMGGFTLHWYAGEVKDLGKVIDSYANAISYDEGNYYPTEFPKKKYKFGTYLVRVKKDQTFQNNIEWGPELGKGSWYQANEKIATLNKAKDEVAKLEKTEVKDKPWRLPTTLELERAWEENIIFEHSVEDEDQYWSSDSFLLGMLGEDYIEADYVSMSDGEQHEIGRDWSLNYARCVRTKKGG